MKKVALSLAGVLAAATFAPEASAVPSFARQTGMACSACHAQHFPVLNGFGRAFKAAGFTMMGSQEKVEGEGLSIPATLNASVLLKVIYEKTSGTAGTPSGIDTNGGAWAFPDELSLFFGGRVADLGSIKIGQMMENNLAAPGAPVIAGLRVPVVVDMDSVKLSVIPYTTDALGPFYGYTESSAGVARGIRWAENRKAVSAHQYVDLGAGAATGLAFVAHSDMGYINVSRYASAFAGATQMSSTAIHIAATPTIADFATILSAEFVTGDNYGAGVTTIQQKGSGFSAQANGEVAGMEASFYGQYAKNDVNNLKAATGGADVTVIPHTLTVGAAYRKATGSDDAFTLTAVYDLAQNVALHANYTSYSQNQGADGNSTFIGLLEAAW